MRCCASWRHLITAAVLTLSLGACPIGAPDDDAGATRDAGATDPCRDALVLDQELTLLAGPDGTQIHVDVAFDGSVIWVTYNAPDADGNFDVYLAQLGCDGEPIGAPQQVNSTLGGNHVDPHLTLGDDELLVTWNADNQTGVDNMDAYLRSYHYDGTPRMASDQILETSRGGAPVTGNVMNPHAVWLDGDRFAIAGSRGHADAPAFQVFVQLVDSDGALIGEAVDGFFEPGAGQIFPALAAASDGSLDLSWLREEVDQDSQVVHTRLAAGASTPAPLPPTVIADSGIDGTAPTFELGPEGHLYLAFSRSGQIVLRDGADPSADAARINFGASGQLDFSPRVVGAPGGGAVFYYGNISGYQNRYLVQPFTFEGTSFELDSGQQLTASPVPPYPPAATHMYEGVYFVAWSEGTSPNFVIKGRFIQL